MKPKNMIIYYPNQINKLVFKFSAININGISVIYYIYNIIKMNF